jgi:predicted membrane channel-forming protein YqfA (hemolysin III family)
LCTIYLLALGGLSIISFAGPLIFPEIWRSPGFRGKRTGLFLLTNVASVVPLFHWWWVDGHRILHAAMDHTSDRSVSVHSLTASLCLAAGRVGVFGGGPGWLLMIVTYLFGVFIYISRIPERLRPGKFDVYFQSHQIWHVLVVTAALIHYISGIEVYRWVERQRRASDLCPIM